MAKKDKTTEPGELLENKSLEMVISSINKQYGNMIIKTNDATIARLPTGSLGLDYILGGGFARGRISELFGVESSGKSTISLHTIAQTQFLGGAAAYVDVENAFDPTYAVNLGIDLDKLVVAQPECAEHALDVVLTLASSKLFDLIILDSVAELVPLDELKGTMEDQQVGLQARIMSKFLRKGTALLNHTDTHLLCINQFRSKIGVMYGNPNVTSGGNALKYYSSQRVELKGKTPIKTDEGITGVSVEAVCIKNKTAPPFRTAELQMEFGKGINKSRELFDLAVKFGIVQKAGAWFSFDGSNIGQGGVNASATIQENPEIKEKVEQLVKEHLK